MEAESEDKLARLELLHAEKGEGGGHPEGGGLHDHQREVRCFGRNTRSAQSVLMKKHK